MSNRYCFKLVILVSTFFLTIRIGAQVSLPSVMSDNMVLQQNSITTFRGWGQSSETIEIIPQWLDGDTVKVKVDDMGCWSVPVKTTKAGGPYSIKFKGSSTVTLKNVMLGEVWLCSGQSNMEWNVNLGIENGEEEAARAGFDNLRIFHLPKRGSISLQDDCESQWEVSSPESMRKTSALGYFFGRYLSRELDVPVGIIVAAWGGTPAEVWTPADWIDNDSLITSCQPKPTPWWPVKPGSLYNGMINPVLSHNIAGCIWYQGESNHECYEAYSSLIEKMITSWRQAFKTEFPFYMVQIAPHSYMSKGNTPALLREQQELITHTVANTGMISIPDLVDNVKNIHPKDKKTVGIRLANMALNKHYKRRSGAYLSPTFANIEIVKNKAIISFDNLVGKLICKEPKIKGVKIASKNGIYYNADVKIQNNKLIVWSSEVEVPVFVSYCFDDDTIGNLFSEEGMPVAPFRSNRNF